MGLMQATAMGLMQATAMGLTAMGVQVSNEIIRRCSAAIALSEVFSPNVDSVSTVLQQCITAGAEWRRLYERTGGAVAAATPERPWGAAPSPVFAHVDALTQRCSDLLEVCGTQLQFSSQRPLPSFGGTNGDEVLQSVEDIRSAFRGRVDALAAGGYPILDVRVTRWHDDFNAFKLAVKDLEELLIKATDQALAMASCLQDRIVLIEALQVWPPLNAPAAAAQCAQLHGRCLASALRMVCCVACPHERPH